MASLPEVIVPPNSADNDEEEPMYEKKPKVDTQRIFKSKKNKSGMTSNEEKLSELREKPKPIYDNDMEEVKVSFSDIKKIVDKNIEPSKTEPLQEVIVDVVEAEEETPSPVVSDTEPTPVLQNEEPTKPVKKKRQMSQKQLDALARGRQNSLKNRQARASTKKEIVESKEVSAEQIRQQPVSTPVFQKPTNYLTKADVEEISVDAITKYDAIRKKRKAVKKEVKETHIADQQTTQQIQRALNPNDMDFYSSCFNISY
tara:strand:- start:3196 stop:3966 length:771 start_codon:yes stop_codon:yes gene_type:complete